MVSQRYIDLQRDGATATIVLDHSETANTWTLESARQIVEVAEQLRFDAEVRAVIVRAEGAAFCAGTDLADLEARATGRSPGERVRNWFEHLRWLHERLATLAHLPQPVIMAIQGPCLGSGLELAMMGDLRVAASDAEFGLPEPRFGFPPETGGELRLAEESGAGWAKLLAFTGRRLDAATALRIGIVQQVVPPGELLSTVRDLAAEIATNAPLAVQGIKRTINSFVEQGLVDAMRFEAISASLCMVSDDLHEGVRARSAAQSANFGGA
jgi:enoyl-CoA hydratase/carnithine racemase